MGLYAIKSKLKQVKKHVALIQLTKIAKQNKKQSKLSYYKSLDKEEKKLFRFFEKSHIYYKKIDNKNMILKSEQGKRIIFKTSSGPVIHDKMVFAQKGQQFAVDSFEGNQADDNNYLNYIKLTRIENNNNVEYYGWCEGHSTPFLFGTNCELNKYGILLSTKLLKRIYKLQHNYGLESYSNVNFGEELKSLNSGNLMQKQNKNIVIHKN